VVEGYMDVVALAQHGVDYAVATLGTATTPVHAQKLFRLTDSVVFCFDGDNAGRKAAWRALENALPVLADGKNASFLLLPDGEDPDDFVRRRGKAAFEAAIANAIPLSEFLLAELAVRHPPATAEGRAALVAAAAPLLAQIAAPVLAAIMRRRLAEMSGLPDSELAQLLPKAPAHPVAEPQRMPAAHAGAARPARPRSRNGVRQPPSLARQLIQGLLLQPNLGRTLPFPRPDDDSPEGNALTVLATYCADATGDLSAAGLIEVFAGSRHADLMAEILAAADDHGLDAAAVEAQVRDGLDRWWQQARRDGETVPASGLAPASDEEAKRLKQLDFIRQRVAGVATATPAERGPDAPAIEPFT
jgi:DNA primase